MTTNQTTKPDVPLALLFGVVIAAALLWWGGVLSAMVSGHNRPRGHVLAGFQAFAHVGDPSRAWGQPVGPATVYWLVTGMLVAIMLTAAWFTWRLFHSLGLIGSRESRNGLASRTEISKAAGVVALRSRAWHLRPSLTKPPPTDLGYRLGRSHGVWCWASVEDSVVVLGPPRSGKGLHLVVPAILDAPGAVVTTSTRPDNLAVTIAARDAVGPVTVFDPQGLARGIGLKLRWSPVRGCVDPQTAMARARSLCVQPAEGVENATFWSQQCYTAVRCLLHAAALSRRSTEELFHWSLSPVAAETACDILRSHPLAAPAWSTALEAILASDPRQRDSIWAMVGNTFAPLADPRVLAALSPERGEELDPEKFLAERGTLYLLGTASGASATARLVSALVEDIVEAARRMAASSPRARLDPPLALILDEAANYPLPSLPALMSEGGGTGITPIVVLQSLAQARGRWGEQEAAAIWDAAIAKVILGGSGNAEDLRNLSALTGMRQEERLSTSWGPSGQRTSSSSWHEVPVLDASRLRTLPFGQAVLLLRATAPILLQLRPWTRREDARQLVEARGAAEADLRHGVAGQL